MVCQRYSSLAHTVLVWQHFNEFLFGYHDLLIHSSASRTSPATPGLFIKQIPLGGSVAYLPRLTFTFTFIPTS